VEDAMERETLTLGGEAIMHQAMLSASRVEGNTPEEKLENFMAALAPYLPEDELQFARDAIAEDFGVKPTEEPDTLMR
jgi:hypothetical protein